MALPKVSDVFKGSFDESLKKLVQPPAIVPGAILVALSVTLLFPAAFSAVPPLRGFYALDQLWQAAILAGAVLVVGYVILSLSGSIMRLATGEMGSDSALFEWLAARNARRIRSLDAQAESARTVEDWRRLTVELTRWPPPRAAAPTRLGNIFAGAAHSLELGRPGASIPCRPTSAGGHRQPAGGRSTSATGVA